MENAEPLGVFSTRTTSGKTTLSDASESGLWQVWKRADGGYIIRPLDATRHPYGSVSVISAEMFDEALTPVPSDMEIASVGRPFLRANSPDLIEIWYEQSRAEAAAIATDASSSGLSGIGYSAGGPGGPFAGDVRFESEPPTSPTSDSVSFRAADAGLPPIFGGEGAEAPAQTVLSERLPSAKSSVPGVGIAGEAYTSELAALQENSMRAEFAELASKINSNSPPSVDEQVKQLLHRPTPDFTWKQKFMFSEFGMVLRRKGKPLLALLAHQRALELAPHDGHILFNVARSEYELGNVPLAREYLREALAVLPDFTPAKSFLEFLDGDHTANGG